MRISLRGQILIYTLTAILLAAVTLAFYTISREATREKEEARLDALNMTQVFSAVVLSDSYLSDPGKLQTLLNAYLSNKNVMSARVYNPQGTPVAKGINPESGVAPATTHEHPKSLQDYTYAEAYLYEDIIEVVCPLKRGGGPLLGYLCVSYNLSELRENLNVQFYDVAMGVLICLIFAFVATIIFSSWIIRPLRELMDKANRIIQGENVPLTLERQDEIGSLALSLNTMLRSINLRDEKLRLLASSLELKVNERTEELEKALKKAEDATQAKANFLASMTHELRTPMNGVIGTASLLADSNLTPEQSEKLSIIRNCGHHLLTVINDILDFSKIEASRMELEIAPVDLRRLVQDAINIVSPLLAAKKLVLSCSIDEAVPTYIEGDSGRLRQVLVNLLSNSIKFTETGGIEVVVRQKKVKDTHVILEFSVKDTGIGIDPEVQKRLFTAFTQADSSTTRKYGGTGLGLVICKKLIELMGGEITIKSKLGKGSTFTFTIKTTATTQKPMEDIYSPTEVQSIMGLTKPMRILLAEDNVVNQMVAKGFLEKLGYHPDIANNGREVLLALQRKDYDLIFMDMMMPEMDGLEATRIICSMMPAQRRPWIIAMTANALEEHRRQCMDAGMNAFMTKPFTLKNLETALLEAPCVIAPGIEEYIAAKHEEKKASVTPQQVKHTYHAINLEKIFNNFKDDEDLVPFAIEAFIKDYPERLKEIESSIQNDNIEQLAIAAHTLKGAVSNFFAEGAVKYALSLEKCAKESDLSEANENLKNLKIELGKVHKELKQLLAELS